jgi:hypothetical protein
MAKALEGSTEQVVSHIRNLIERGQLRRGDRLPMKGTLDTAGLGNGTFTGKVEHRLSRSNRSARRWSPSFMLGIYVD